MVQHSAIDHTGITGVGGAIDWGETGDITDQDYDDVADAGVLNEAARADHLHGMPSAGSAIFKRTVLIGNGNKTTTNSSFAAIDTTNLAYLTLTLAVGDVVRCTLVAQVNRTASGGTYAIDFEVDQPTSGDVRVGGAADYGVYEDTIPTNSRQGCNAMGLFTATEAGSHGFRPMWRTDGGSSLTMYNDSGGGNSDTTITFIVEKLGAPA